MKEAVELLRVVADVRQIGSLGTNTMTIRDTPERLDAVAKLLSAIDKAKAEVVVNVELWSGRSVSPSPVGRRRSST
jgi:type II secretory pathway component GspD/PulD (secretin)